MADEMSVREVAESDAVESARAAAFVAPDVPVLLGVAFADEDGPMAGARVRSTLVVGTTRTALPDSICDGLGRFRVDVSLADGLEGGRLESAEVECLVTCDGWVFDVDSVWLESILDFVAGDEIPERAQWKRMAGRQFSVGEDFVDDMDFVEIGTRGSWLEGRVVDGAGLPALGAMVWIGVRDQTDADGTGELYDYVEVDAEGCFLLAIQSDDVSEGLELTLHAAHAGLGKSELALQPAVLAKPGLIEMRLEQLGTVSGRVVSTAGKSVAGARVWIGSSEADWLRPDEVTSVEVGAHGDFTFRGLPAGSWELGTMDEAFGPFETGAAGIVLEVRDSMVRVEALAPAHVALGGAILEVWPVGAGANGWRALGTSWRFEDRVRERAPGVWDVEVQEGVDFAFAVTMEESSGGAPGEHSWFGSAVVEGSRADSPAKILVGLALRGESEFELVLLDPDGARLAGSSARGRLLDPESSALVARVRVGKPESVPSGMYRLELEADDWLFDAEDIALVWIPPAAPSAFEVRASGQGGRLCLNLTGTQLQEGSRDNERYDVRMTPSVGGSIARTLWGYSSGCVGGRCFTVGTNCDFTSSRAFEPGVWRCELVPFGRGSGEGSSIEFDVTLVRGQTARVSVELAEDGVSSRVQQR